MSLKLSVVVPCYNEEKALIAFHDRMVAACRVAAGESYEIVFVNDGSCDRTIERLRSIVVSNPRVVVVDLFRNHGHQLAVTAGLSIVRGERVMLIDADLQDPPELLSAFMQKMDEGFDVVYGQRVSRDGETMFKLASAKLFYRILSRVSITSIPVDTGDFRLMKREVVSRLNEMPEAHRFIRGMVAWIGGRQAPIEYERASRYAGETKYTFTKMAQFGLDAITGFSTAPLRIAIFMSAASAALATALLLYVAISYLLFTPAPGWTSLVAIILIFSSVQLFCTGIVGEYVGRIFMQVKERPLTHIRSVTYGDQELGQETDEPHLRR